MAQPTRDTLYFPASQARLIDPYLPLPQTSPQPPTPSTSEPHPTQSTLSPSTQPPFTPPKPHTTLTFATSLDSTLSLSPSTPTPLSGPDSKAMTHYLRAHHDAILIGVGTAIADDPSLNCRIAGAVSPRPVILDPTGRWDVHAQSKVVALAREGKGLGPWVIVRKGVRYDGGKRGVLEGVGGRVMEVSEEGRMRWQDILTILAVQGVKSVMIEGGGTVINDLLVPGNFDLVDSVIVTIAPVWLGKGGVQVCPEERREGERKVAVGRLAGVKWVPLGEDVVLCGRPN